MNAAARAAHLSRPLARIATALAVLETGLALYVYLFGGVRVDLGPWRLSAGTWWHPFTQAVVLAFIAAWLFYRDASTRGEWDYVPRTIWRAVTSAAVAVKNRPLLWAAVVAGSLLSLFVGNRLVVDQSWIIGSKEGGWTYPYVGQVTRHVMAIAALVVALGWAALFWRPARDTPRGEWTQVCVWLVVATGLQALLRSLAPFGFEPIFLSEGANSFYTVTQQHSAASVLADFNNLRETWPLHAHSNMPGKLLMLYALELVSTQPAVLAWLMVLLSNVGGVFFYLFVRELFGDRRVAMYSLMLYLFVPARLFFFPIMNVVTPAVAFAWAVLVLKWLRSGRASYAAVSGVALYGLVLFEPIPLVLGALFAIIAFRALLRGEFTWRRLLQHIGVLLAAFIATWAMVWVSAGFDLFDAFRRVAADAAAFNAAEGRPHGLWARQNLIDFLFGVGICQAVLFLAAAADGLRRRGDTRPRLDRPIVVLCISLVVMLLALDLSGVNRGEAIRLWIFLACLAHVPAAYVCARLGSRLAIAMVLGTTLIFAALGTATIGFVVP